MASALIRTTHIRKSSSLPFADYVQRLEGKLGRLDPATYEDLLNDSANNAEVEKIIRKQEGLSGFMIFATYDHGALLQLRGGKRKARQYVIGNPLIASTMTEHDTRAALYVPLRILVYEDEGKKTRIEYDLPSSFLKQFANTKITTIALDLDKKIETLLEGE